MEWEVAWWEVVSRVREVPEKHQGGGAVGHPRRGPTSAGYYTTLPIGHPHCVQAGASTRGMSCLKVVALGPKSFAMVHQGGFGHDGACVWRKSKSKEPPQLLNTGETTEGQCSSLLPQEL